VYYPPATFGDDMSSGFGFRMLTYRHTHMRTEPLNALTPYAVITITMRLRSDYYDTSRAPASIRREQKMNMSVFCHSGIV